MDVNKLLLALEDEANESLMNFNSKKINSMNNDVISELNFDKRYKNEVMEKLKGYKYVDEINDLRYGTYIRWINIENPNNVYLRKGAIFCKVDITDEGI